MKPRSLHHLREAERLSRAALKQLDKAARAPDASDGIRKAIDTAGDALVAAAETLDAQAGGQA
jgi:hypothetical protein